LTLTRALRVRVSTFVTTTKNQEKKKSLHQRRRENAKDVIEGKNVTVANQFTVSLQTLTVENGNRTLFCPIFICRDLYSNSKYLNEESQKEQTKCYSSEPVYSSTAKGSNWCLSALKDYFQNRFYSSNLWKSFTKSCQFNIGVFNDTVLGQSLFAVSACFALCWVLSILSLWLSKSLTGLKDIALWLPKISHRALRVNRLFFLLFDVTV